MSEGKKYCENDKHDFVEEYYGQRCSKCDLFYPHGCAPWDPYCEKCHAMFEEECACDNSDNYGPYDEE